MRFTIFVFAALLGFASFTIAFAQDEGTESDHAIPSFGIGDEVLPGSEQDGVRTYTGRVGQDTLVRILRMKAKDGKNLDAQFDLCNFYAQKASYEESAKWCQIAADRGDVEAQVKMAEIYTEGQGVAASKTEAFNWYLLAAENGSETAQFAVASAYSNGDGVGQSDADAYFWLNIAPSGHDGQAAQDHLAELAQKMGPEKLAAQQQRIKDWQAKHPPK